MIHCSLYSDDDSCSGCQNVNVTTNSPSQDYNHPDDHDLLTSDPNLRVRLVRSLQREVQVVIISGNRLHLLHVPQHIVIENAIKKDEVKHAATL